MKSLEEVLTQSGIISAKGKKLFAEKATQKMFPKNALILLENKKDEMEYLVLDGVLHRYNTDSSGKSITTGFYMAGTIITPHFARTNKGKSLFNLQALTEVTFVQIPVKELDILRGTYAEFREFGQYIVERELTQLFLTETIFRSSTASERLAALRKQYPTIENLVPHHIIASYLGITNVSFSRLRSQRSR
jgi:CRP-like cAMP-binding protein